MVALLARLRPVDEAGVLGRLGEIENPPLRGDRADEALAHREPRHVHSFLAQAVRCEQFELVVAQQVDGAYLARHLVGDEVDDLVELGLCRAAPRHHLVEAGQDLPG